MKAIQKAIDVLGGQRQLGDSIGVQVAQVWQWTNAKRPVPIEHCVAIEKATKGAVTRQELRPDDFWLIWPDLKKPNVLQAVGNGGKN